MLPVGGSAGTISVKFCTEVRGWPAYTAVKKYWRKLQPRVGCTNVADDRQTTDGIAIAKTHPNVTFG